jgi:hypothetical protein
MADAAKSDKRSHKNRKGHAGTLGDGNSDNFDRDRESNVQIHRAMILAQLARGDSLQSVAAVHHVHPFIIRHIELNRRMLTMYTPKNQRTLRMSGGARRKLNPEDLRAALAAGKTIKEIFAASECSKIASIYKACARWGIPLPTKVGM